MPFTIRVHFDNASSFAQPHLWQWADGSALVQDLAPAGQDGFGPFFDVHVARPEFRFKFKEGPGQGGPWEPDRLNRFYSWLTIGRIVFGLYHPNAARVYVMGSFNGWQRPGADDEDPDRFIEAKLYRGYFGVPNIWLAVTDLARRCRGRIRSATTRRCTAPSSAISDRLTISAGWWTRPIDTGSPC